MIKHYFILITPVFRTNNLIYIARNIVERFKAAKHFVPFWILCFDKYHADLSEDKIKELEKFCNDNNLTYKIYYEGIEGEANYGGSLMNNPLQDIKNTVFVDENPLVYVLDDDNIINKNFVPYLETVAIGNDKSVWLNMLDEFGAQRFARSIDRLAFLPGTGKNKGYNIIHRCATCDPSQIVIRLNRLLELGGFGVTRLYDFELMNKIYANKAQIDDTMIFQGNETSIPNKNFFITSYHNGLVTKDLLNSAIENLENKFSETKEDSYIRIHTADYNFNLELSNEEVLKILKERLNDC